jgi:hypothetical protein
MNAAAEFVFRSFQFVLRGRNENPRRRRPSRGGERENIVDWRKELLFLNVEDIDPSIDGSGNRPLLVIPMIGWAYG